jgi:hypothetical protein
MSDGKEIDITGFSIQQLDALQKQFAGELEFLQQSYGSLQVRFLSLLPDAIFLQYNSRVQLSQVASKRFQQSIEAISDLGKDSEGFSFSQYSHLSLSS